MDKLLTRFANRGKPVIESKDISLFVVDEISQDGKLLPKDQQARQSVMDLVELHFKVIPLSIITQKYNFPFPGV